MISEIAHVGVTVSDIERSIAFYRDVVGLEFIGRMTMDGEETARLFARDGCTCEVAYLRRGNSLCPPLELIQFTDAASSEKETDLFTTSISEICFVTDDIEADYERMKSQGVDFLSEPRYFDSRPYGFTESKAVYFRDPDGIIMELMQYL